MKKYGLICAMAPNGMPGAPFVKGYNNPKYHEELITRAKQSIDACSEAGFPSVIAFTGYKWREAEDPKSGEISREEGADNCVKGLKQLVGHEVHAPAVVDPLGRGPLQADRAALAALRILR